MYKHMLEAAIKHLSDKQEKKPTIDLEEETEEQSPAEEWEIGRMAKREAAAEEEEEEEEEEDTEDNTLEQMERMSGILTDLLESADALPSGSSGYRKPGRTKVKKTKSLNKPKTRGKWRFGKGSFWKKPRLGRLFGIG
ncbi:unnamed protein product [Heligmosomoides polygyrus]|uniref:Uncharacterized protein n=1 Tax=Heligmosomoides polygyrus TaxID=6339 RepID=A0A183FT61_HELPZ|nr:unnamed protein product [Heligmosomoides polygyrus]